MNTNTHTPIRAIAAAVVALAAFVFAMTAAAQNTGPGRPEGRRGYRTADSTITVNRRPFMRRPAPQDIVKELPEDAQSLALKNGEKLYFHDGTLYRFAEKAKGYIALPQRASGAQVADGTHAGARFRMDRGRRAGRRDRMMHRRHWMRFHARGPMRG